MVSTCESFGARLKKLIKHLTCRRRCLTDNQGAPVDHVHTRTVAGEKKVWTQAFSVGYIKTAFTRACVSSANLYTKENAPYMQRADANLLATGSCWEAPSRAKTGPRAQYVCAHGAGDEMSVLWVVCVEYVGVSPAHPSPIRIDFGHKVWIQEHQLVHV